MPRSWVPSSVSQIDSGSPENFPCPILSSLSKCVIDARPTTTLLPGPTAPNHAEQWTASIDRGINCQYFVVCQSRGSAPRTSPTRSLAGTPAFGGRSREWLEQWTNRQPFYYLCPSGVYLPGSLLEVLAAGSRHAATGLSNRDLSHLRFQPAAPSDTEDPVGSSPGRDARRTSAVGSRWSWALVWRIDERRGGQ